MKKTMIDRTLFLFFLFGFASKEREKIVKNGCSPFKHACLLNRRVEPPASGWKPLAGGIGRPGLLGDDGDALGLFAPKANSPFTTRYP